MKYKWVDKYLLAKRGVTKDYHARWKWDRYMVGDKLFAAVCYDESGKDMYVSMKLDPAEGEMLRMLYADVIPGFYMNKIHWNSVKTNGHLPDSLLQEMLDTSYELVLSGLSGKKQKEILGEE